MAGKDKSVEKKDKKTAAKKAPAKKAVVKKAAVKKPAAKKVPAKKAAVKKPAAKKAPAKKKTAKSAPFKEKILVSIDATESSEKAVAYLANLGGLIGSCQLTLCHILPTIPPDMLEDGGSENPDVELALKAGRDEDIGEWEDKIKTTTRKIFEGYKKKLVDSGIPAANINTKVIGRTLDIGKSVVNTAKKGGYTTIVVGRRGVSFLQELALGSVSYRIVKLAKDITVWVVH